MSSADTSPNMIIQESLDYGWIALAVFTVLLFHIACI